MKTKISILKIILVVLFATTLQGHAINPKREFRGSWLHTVGQNHFAGRTTEENKSYLTEQLDLMEQAGINAVIFQVRCCSDAFYDSKIEPWSTYLTGKIGQEPESYWDPLEFMIAECHQRGMELHAWLNPYRSFNIKDTIPASHITQTHPERFVIFNERYYFDPGQPENREYICGIVADILDRYDVDAIHMDDYFYPYPVKGKVFNDSKSFKTYGNGKALNDWRRENVNLLISDLSQVIHSMKPWVRFGISPFGIWRNKASDPDGSETNGLQNYDDLYADVILWAKEGWIDYQVPQLYWELGHKRAPSGVLADWWNDHTFGRHLYIGQDAKVCMDHDELDTKITMSRLLDNIQGNVWWPSVIVTSNYKDINDALGKGAQSTKALTPLYPWLSGGDILFEPDAPTNLRIKDDNELTWKAPIMASETPSVNDIAGFVVYKLDSPFLEEGTDNPENIVAIVRGSNSVKIPSTIVSGTWLTVSSFDRLNNESQPSEPILFTID